jgi:Crinkler effector protein N-terminal domain
MEDLRIFVVLLEDSPPSRHIFLVTAPANQTVSELKELVYAKKRNRFKAIDPSDLTLWKVLQLCSLSLILCWNALITS